MKLFIALIIFLFSFLEAGDLKYKDWNYEANHRLKAEVIFQLLVTRNYQLKDAVIFKVCKVAFPYELQDEDIRKIIKTAYSRLASKLDETLPELDMELYVTLTQDYIRAYQTGLEEGFNVLNDKKDFCDYTITYILNREDYR